MNIRNTFFEAALKRAASLAGKRGRLLVLLSRLAMKLRNVNWRNVNVATAREKFSVLGRLVKAYALGHYRDIPWKTVLLIVAAIIYFVSPIDLIPDLVPLTGLTDDLGILLWVYNSVNNEVDKFLTWEKSQVTA